MMSFFACNTVIYFYSNETVPSFGSVAQVYDLMSDILRQIVQIEIRVYFYHAKIATNIIFTTFSGCSTLNGHGIDYGWPRIHPRGSTLDCIRTPSPGGAQNVSGNTISRYLVIYILLNIRYPLQPAWSQMV